MVCLTPDEFLSRLQPVETIIPEPVLVISLPPSGRVVPLSHYRSEMQKRRVDSVGKPGVRLDTGPTGSGKSTADLAAFAAAGRSLSIQPTHENCAEVVESCRMAGLDAVAYPGRTTKRMYQNCWNPAADKAQELGLSVIQAVCNVGCEHRDRCLLSGYLGKLAEAKAARVAVATHERAIHTSLETLSDGRDFVSIHEDGLEVLCPDMEIAAPLLVIARDVLHRLLNDPIWLKCFGDAVKFASDGVTFSANTAATNRREARYCFFRHLAGVVDRLIEWTSEASESCELPVTESMPEAPGTQAVLLRICRELDVNFKGKPVWPLLLKVATGKHTRLGVIIDERLR